MNQSGPNRPSHDEKLKAIERAMASMSSPERKRRLIDKALEQAQQLTPSIDVDETVWAMGSGDGAISMVRCPSCCAEIETDSILASGTSVCSCCGSQLQRGYTAEELGEVPARIGSFVLTRRLGIGAFGQVWLAHDEQLDRPVAIKFPRAIDRSKKHRELFLSEARNAAALRHPHIVTVHEVGEIDDLVYIVHEYVEALPLDRWLDRHRPTVRESADLCITVAGALQAAHDQGVIHRDLKPSNILIDQSGQPWVTDFGLAQRHSNRITINQQGRVLGTPAYMSPEQAAGQSDQSDARSDLYSLGVILFELLTGEKPFRGDSQALIRQVQENDPPPPRSLNRNIPRDLETICCKCLEKKPTARYPSAMALADDLRRWTENKPIQARPAGNLERAWRWCQRNPVVTGLIAAALLALVGGLVGVTWQWQKTRSALATAQNEKQRGDQLLIEAQNVVDGFLVDISLHEDALRRSPGTRQVRRQFLDKARNYYQSFIDLHPSHRASTGLVRAWLGNAEVSLELNECERAIEEASQGAELARELIAANVEPHRNRGLLAQLNNAAAVASYKLNRLPESRALIQAALAQGQSETDTDGSVRVQADSENLLGTLHYVSYQTDKSLHHFEQAEQLYARLHERKVSEDDGRMLANVRLNLAQFWMEQHDFGKARGYLDGALKILWPGDPRPPLNSESFSEAIVDYPVGWCMTLARAHQLVAKGHYLRREYDQARKILDESRGFYQQLERFDLGNLNYSLGLAESWYLTGMSFGRQLRRDEAFAALDKAQSILDELDSQYPDNIQLDYQQLIIRERSAHTFFNFGEPDRALDQISSALDIRQKLVEQFPDTAEYRLRKAVTHLEYGNFLMRLQQSEQARDQHETAWQMASALLAEGYDDPQAIKVLADAHYSLAGDADAEGDYANELEHAGKACKLHRQLLDQNPQDLQAIMSYRQSLSGMGLALMDHDRYEESIEHFEESLQLTMDKLLHRPDFEFLLGGDLVNLANARMADKRYEDALETIREATDTLESFTSQHPRHVMGRQFLNNAALIESRTLARYTYARLNQANQTTDFANLIADATRACELSNWNHEPLLRVLAKVLKHAEDRGTELEELLEDLPVEHRDRVQQLIEDFRAASQASDN